MQINLSTPITIVAHDAGGANQIISLLKSYKNTIDVQAYMQGPALKLWNEAFPNKTLCSSLEKALNGSQSLLTGTGWASNLEFDALKKAINIELYTVAILDHWTNYEQRFIRGGHIVRPNEYWVTDQYAFTIAKQTFPNGAIIQVPNWYLQIQTQQILPPQIDIPTLLYIQEPVRSNWGREYPGEFQALDYMVEKLPVMSLPENIHILLRPHPSEDHNKYSHWLKQHTDINITLDKSPTLADAISQAQWVAGCESYALVVALTSGRTVYCTLPPWAPTCRLPHKGLIQLKSL